MDLNFDFGLLPNRNQWDFDPPWVKTLAQYETMRNSLLARKRTEEVPLNRNRPVTDGLETVYIDEMLTVSRTKYVHTLPIVGGKKKFKLTQAESLSKIQGYFLIVEALNPDNGDLRSYEGISISITDRQLVRHIHQWIVKLRESVNLSKRITEGAIRISKYRQYLSIEPNVRPFA